MEQLLLLLLIIPFVGSVITFISGNNAKMVAFATSLIGLAATLVMVLNFTPNAETQFVLDYPWIQEFGIQFYLGVDGISMITVLLTNVLLPIIILAGFKHNHQNPSAFYGLMLFMQWGLLLVFTSLDAFLFYIGWEAALIPIYFICALWGGENRIKVNMKFFVYTIAGSLFMLLGIIYLYLQNPERNFSIQAFYALNLDATQQAWIFWAFFIAFAIKMPIFPFHTWQPDTYTSAPTQGTMLLSGIMLKMGIYGVIRWLLPIVPLGVQEWGMLVIILSVIGVVYASVIAFTRNDSKRLIAYSSISHVGLISAGIFASVMVGAENVEGMQGAMIQMLSHGINVVGLFFVIDVISQRMGTAKLSELGGMAKKAPQLAIAFLTILLGTVALPGTNGFPGEFLLLVGLFKYNIWITVIAGMTIIFSAVYMFRMFQKTMLGAENDLTFKMTDITGSEKAVLFIICTLVIAIGIYPKPIFEISEASVQNLLQQIELKLQR